MIIFQRRNGIFQGVGERLLNNYSPENRGNTLIRIQSSLNRALQDIKDNPNIHFQLSFLGSKEKVINSLQKNGFLPVIGERPKVLILGSIPGEKSLDDQQYYAHPRNAFWFIMQELLGISVDTPYQNRLNLLIENGVALWDVLQSCEREGSLDASIKNSSIEVNDFSDLLLRYPSIELIAFNGAKAEQEFIRRVVPMLSDHAQQLARARLPSSSPAMASLKKEEKLAIWKAVLNTQV